MLHICQDAARGEAASFFAFFKLHCPDHGTPAGAGDRFYFADRFPASAGIPWCGAKKSKKDIAEHR